MPKRVIDIFKGPLRPKKSPEETPDSEPATDQPSLPRSPDQPISFRLIKNLFILLVVVGVVFYGYRIVRIQGILTSASSEIQTHLGAAKDAFGRFDIDGARDALGSADSEIESAYRSVSSENIFSFSFRAVPDIFKNIFSVGRTTLTLAEEATYLVDNAFDFILNDNGDELIAGLADLRTHLRSLTDLGSEIQEQSAQLGYEAPEQLISADAQVFAIDQFLGALISWLGSDEPQHIVILFQNISEMRPGGGFGGSYAAATLTNGSLTELDVRDIYDPDGQLDTRIVPPRPLQGITTYWGARDANWFFNFPTSAKKLTELLELSKIYQEQDRDFGAVIAVNTNVLSDIIQITGPITLTEYNREINHENFLDAIQEEVRSGADRETGDPKRIIRITTPVLFERLKNLDGSKKQELFRTLGEHIQKKNIMIYFDDLVIQSFIEGIDASGSVFQMPSNGVGDYLAVANANIASGKTDAVINQTITLTSVIDLEGEVHNTLVIERDHQGDKRNEWWYRSTNKNYITVFTPKGSRLVRTTGNDPVPSLPNRSYTNALRDRDLEILENSDIVFGKTAFSSWLLTKPGETSRLEVQYDTPYKLDMKNERIPYTFAFDKQSGVMGSLSVTVKAPAGHIWESTKTRTLSFFEENPDAQIVRELVLLKR